MADIEFEEIPLEQFDNFEGDYGPLGDIPKAYWSSIGFFVILFSSLEHSINNEIADHMSDRSHDVGYRVASTLRMKEKIDFLHHLLLSVISTTEQDKKAQLKDLISRLTEINKFRNYLAHANWATLKTDGTVRIRISTDSNDGLVKFKNARLPVDLIQEKIEEVDSLIEELGDFSMGVHNDALGS